MSRIVIALLMALCITYGAAEDVGIAGTGAMGNALGSCLLKSGKSVIAWNRTPSKTKTLKDAGASTTDDLSDLFKKTDTVIMTVVGDSGMKTANEMLHSVGNGLKGKTVVQWTTHDPLAAEAQAKIVEGYGGIWIGGAMMAVPSQVCDPEGLYFLSGSNQQVYDGVAKKLESLGTMEYYGQAPGLGSLYDIAILMHFFFGYFGHLLALSIIEAAGGDYDVYFNKSMYIFKSWLDPLHSNAFTHIKENKFKNAATMLMPAGSLVPGFEMHLNYFKQINVDAAMLEAVIKQYHSLFEKHPDTGNFDLAVLAKYMNRNNEPTAIKSEL